MTDAERGQVAAPAAEVYEQFFVPALFGQFAGPVLDAAGVGTGAGAGDGLRVLDVGCGTGVVARAAAARLGGAGEVVGLDLNEGMLAVARQAPLPAGARPVEWRRGAAEALPWPDATFDAVTSAFALMFVADRRAALAEMARVTRPGGRVALATWASVDRSPGYRALVDLLDRVVGEEAAAALRAPFVLGDPEGLRALVAPALPGVTVTECAGTARFASIDAWLHTEVRGWTLAGMVDDATYARLRAEAPGALGEVVDQVSGQVAFPAPALVAVARRT